MRRSNFRRIIFSAAAFTALHLLATCGPRFSADLARRHMQEAWQMVPGILSRISPPTFPNREFSILDFGARPDSTDCREGIQRAISACASAGGGHVIIPAGVYFVKGPIHLQSNVDLHLQRGAKLYFSTDPRDYTPLVKVRWEGTLCYNYSPLIYAYRQKNIAVTGEGLLDGQTEKFWFAWKKRQTPDKKRLRRMGNDVVPVETRVFGNGFLDLNSDGKDDGHGDGKPHFLRPAFIEFFECRNVLIQGITLKSSPFWNVHPVFCRNVTIRNVRVRPGITNDDGIDPDSCTDVLIENCTVRTHDDAIAVKAGRDQDAWRRPPTENVIIRRNSLSSGVNGFCIGSEMSGGVRNVFVEDNHIFAAERGITFKTNLDRGGQVEKIYIRNMEIDTCRDAMFVFRMDYHGYRGNRFPTKFNDFYASNIRCLRANRSGLRIVGVEGQHIRRVYLHNITIGATQQPAIIRFADDLLVQNVKINGRLWQPELRTKTPPRRRGGAP